jgi:hypothetical protein
MVFASSADFEAAGFTSGLASVVAGLPNIWPAVEPGSGSELQVAVGGGSAMGMGDAMACRNELRDRAEVCAKGGFKIQARVWTIGADLCRAAAWAAQDGVPEAERRVAAYYAGS